MNKALKLTFPPYTPQLTDLRILKVRQSGVQAQCDGPGAPTAPLSAKVRDRSLSLSHLSDTSAPPPPPSYHTRKAPTSCSLSPRLCVMLQHLSLLLCTGENVR